MTVKVNAIRVDLRGDEVVITAMGQSPRGTKVRLRQETAKGRKGDKETFRQNIVQAIEKVIAPPA